MRAAIGEMELDEILHARASLNSIIKKSVAEAASDWGISVKRYEITDMTPDKFITEVRPREEFRARGVIDSIRHV